MSRRPQLTVRARLTLLYTGLFAVCGAIVVAVSYILVARLAPQGQDQQAPASFLARCRSEQLSTSPDERILAKCDAYVRLQGAKHQRDLTVDRARHRASRGGRALSLTRKEFGILETLLAADGVLVSAEELLEHVWDANADPASNIVSVTMARLRRKLGDPLLIETVVGKGYRM